MDLIGAAKIMRGRAILTCWVLPWLVISDAQPPGAEIGGKVVAMSFDERSTASKPETPVGDWAGWIYLDGGSDLPLRVHFRESEEGTLRGTVTLPSEDLFGAEITEVVWEPPEISFAFLTPSGRRIDLSGTAEGAVVAGRFELPNGGGDFEMIRSVVPLPDPDPDGYPEVVGIYGAANGGGVSVDKWFWGELQFTDLVTGARGTLFGVSPHTLFAGSAQYSPDSISAWATFVQAPEEPPTHLVWHRTGQAPDLLPREPLRHEEIEFTNDDVTLSGTLLLPPTPGPHPVAVFLGGSGWRSRNYSLATAQIFASRGIGAFIYDQRGYEASEGEQVVSFQTTARDAIAAVRRLQAHPDVRRDQVGLTGNSRGGWIAPLAASLSNDVAFLVLWVAPAVSPADQETTRRLNVLRQQGLTHAELAEARSYLQLLWEYGRTGEGWDKYAAARRRVMAAGWTVLGGPESSEPEEWDWIRMNGHYDPIPVLERIRVPVIALYGERDPNVVPEENAPLMAEALGRAGNPDVTIEVIPEANHIFRIVDPEQPTPPLHRARGYAPESWQIPVEWLRARLGLETP